MRPNIKFTAQERSSFHSDLTKAVNQYFKENNISKHANFSMYLKTFILLCCYFIPYGLILGVSMPLWNMWLLCLPMGFALAGIGMSIMHDSCHGSYSSKPWVNNLMSYSMYLVGGNKFSWVIQHNVKHHTYTNIFNADEDLDNGDVIRLSPYSNYKKFHRFQHIYSWFLYMFGTLSWVTLKDFKQFKNVFSHAKDASYSKELTILIVTKIFYYIYMLVIPALVLDISFGYIFLGFLTIHLLAGIILSVTFQLAHVVEITEHHEALPDDPKQINDSWAIHQIKTTANFARKSKFLNWYLGGLNFQIEHHLFPHICHVHYYQISKIVKKVVNEYDLKYNEFDTLSQAIKSHYKALKAYSKNEVTMTTPEKKEMSAAI